MSFIIALKHPVKQSSALFSTLRQFILKNPVTFVRMKTTIVVSNSSKEKIELLIKVAREMGITVEAMPAVDEVTIVSEPSLSEAWNSKEDERWDKAYGKKK